MEKLVWNFPSYTISLNTCHVCGMGHQTHRTQWVIVDWTSAKNPNTEQTLAPECTK